VVPEVVVAAWSWPFRLPALCGDKFSCNWRAARQPEQDIRLFGGQPSPTGNEEYHKSLKGACVRA
jgi:hypothetical protein